MQQNKQNLEALRASTKKRGFIGHTGEAISSVASLAASFSKAGAVYGQVAILSSMATKLEVATELSATHTEFEGLSPSEVAQYLLLLADDDLGIK